MHAASDQKLEVGRPGNEATLLEQMQMCSHWYGKLLSVLLLGSTELVICDRLREKNVLISTILLKLDTLRLYTAYCNAYVYCPTIPLPVVAQLE